MRKSKSELVPASVCDFVCAIGQQQLPTRERASQLPKVSRLLTEFGQLRAISDDAALLAALSASASAVDETELWAPLPYLLASVFTLKQWETSAPLHQNDAITGNRHCLAYAFHALLTMVETSTTNSFNSSSKYSADTGMPSTHPTPVNASTPRPAEASAAVAAADADASELIPPRTETLPLHRRFLEASALAILQQRQLAADARNSNGDQSKETVKDRAISAMLLLLEHFSILATPNSANLLEAYLPRILISAQYTQLLSQQPRNTSLGESSEKRANRGSLT
mmetsp:Transcript_23173/g.50685  ORF Transcript_23173/g.50685 Transcript_23173/m.50685 type:complete len:283 (-) Transcript_23173:185-1033(-)